MNSFRIALGPCTVCKKAAAEIEVGTKACDSCREVFSNLCPACAKKPCRRCKGTLKPVDDVYPYSVFRAISDSDRDEMARLLRENGGRFDLLKSRSGEPLLHAATRAKQKGAAVEICESLLHFGLDPSLRDENGRTALIEMVRLRIFNKNVADLLRSSVNDQDSDGRTALMFAAIGAGFFGLRRGNSTIARELLDLGADPCISDNSGETALGWAIASNDTEKNGEMIEFLEQTMLRETALREFKRRYSYSFDGKGVMQYSEKQVQKSRR